MSQPPFRKRDSTRKSESKRKVMLRVAYMKHSDLGSPIVVAKIFLSPVSSRHPQSMKLSFWNFFPVSRCDNRPRIRQFSFQ